jgi:hypothetical protein
MKNIFILSIIVLLAQAAFAENEYDYVVITKTGYAQVWHNIEKKDGQYCSRRSLFEDCISAKDIKSIKQVEPGTVDAREVGIADTAGLDIMSDNMWAAQYDEKRLPQRNHKTLEKTRKPPENGRSRSGAMGKIRHTR